MEAAAQEALNALGCPDSELSLLIVDSGRMAELHEEYVGKKGPTNVLAFPMTEGPFAEINPEIIGDVVICTDVAAQEAADAQADLDTRILELLIHGILHLVGHDHAEPEETSAMQAKESELFEKLKDI